MCILVVCVGCNLKKLNQTSDSTTAHELRRLVDKANAPIFGINVGGKVNEWNDKTAEITGYSRAEALNEPFVERFIAPHLQESVSNILQKALEGTETANYELEFRTKSNEFRYLLVNATTRLDMNNKIIGVVGVAQDVTETTQHDKAVAAMANELRQLIGESFSIVPAVFCYVINNLWHFFDRYGG